MANEVLNQYICFDMDYHNYIPVAWTKGSHTTTVKTLLCTKCMGRLEMGNAKAADSQETMTQDLDTLSIS